MVSIIMTEDDIRHELSMDVKRIEGIIERIDITCKKYNDEKMDAALTILKSKSVLENVRNSLPHMSNLLNE